MSFLVVFSLLIKISLSITHSNANISNKGNSNQRSFRIYGDEFEMDGKPFRYVSGSFHYFRTDADKWEDIILKMKNCGLNAIQTYVAWNLHEPTKGHFNFTGNADIVRFVELVQKHGMYLILRPGPFICAEWEFGGFPYWLLQDKSISLLRSSDKSYMNHVRDYFGVLFDKLRPYMYHNGGPIIMVQIENEYGYHGICDHEYLKQLVYFTKEKLGDETFLFTVDPPSQSTLECGSVKDLAYVTVDFGTGDPQPHFELMRSINGFGPYVNTEFYPGWLDHWEEAHHYVDTDAVTSSLDRMLELGGNVNFYMFIGGTNFNFYNGANGDSSYYQADPTSYDYDAPLSEPGDMTFKYQKVKETIEKYQIKNSKEAEKFHLQKGFSKKTNIDVKNTTKKAYGKVTFTEGASLFDLLPYVTQRELYSMDVMSFEDLDVDYGFVMYETNVDENGQIWMPSVHDRANVFTNGRYVGTVKRNGEYGIDVETGKVSILVENMGRINFGQAFNEYKGLVGGVEFNSKPKHQWLMRGFNLSNINNIKQLINKKELPTKVPAFYKATFTVDQVADTFLNPKGFTKGVVFINGNNIGRYWTVGPQLTVYVPSYFLHEGDNELIIFEYESQSDTVGTMKFEDKPQIDIY
ncbi:Beta-galactosidase [Tritrichomonas foetus]|uniref:Beta-galactosidase n=1 Tax=Tritrichomonas foetus TaxID=1144522 RepID=A0A1J4JE54_9EUKA|nr:Beta-galactosidase [Tritrichomonas foetus]|eukprot:OHS96929.1 Beta-galactosidase [Tritrichomonas foetus]